MNKKLLIFICYLALFSTLHGEDLYFHHIGLSEGLSHSHVYGITQDKNGFLWFATNNGLNRFDGYTIQEFKHATGKISLSDNDTSALISDSNGVLWIGTWGGGINRYFPDKNKFDTHLLEEIDKIGASGSTRVQTMFQDRHGNLWIGTYDSGLIKLSEDVENSRVFQTPELSSNRVWSLCDCEKNNMWIGTDYGLNRLNLDNMEITVFYADNQSSGLSHNRIRSIARDPENPGKLWIGTQNGLCIMNMKAEIIKPLTFTRPMSPSPIINDLVFENSHILWAATSNKGLIRIDTRDMTHQIYSANYDKSGSLSNNYITCLFIDDSDNMWIGTQGGGVNRLNLKENPFITLRHSSLSDISLSGNKVTSVFQDSKGLIWIGTDRSGLNCYNAAQHHITYYNHQEEDTNSLVYNRVWSILETRKGNLLIGTYGKGINLYNRETNTFKEFFYVKNLTEKSALSRVKTMMESSDGSLWIGTEGGIVRVFQNKNDSQLFTDYNSGLNNPFVWDIFEDSTGNIWAGTEKGLVLYSKNENRFIPAGYAKPSATGFSDRKIFSILESDPGILWLGTASGLIIFNHTSNSSIITDIPEVLSKTPILGILKDQKDRIWVSTSNKIFLINADRSDIKQVRPHYRPEGNEYNFNACYVSNDGDIMFGGLKGLDIIKRGAVVFSDVNPQIVITSFKVFNKELEMDIPVYAKKSLTLDYTQNFFSFEFSSLDYTLPDRNQFQYKLEGLDKDWVNSGSRHFANYTDIRHGNYIFKVRGSNSEGIWSSNTAELEITITPPFWRTYWFYSLLGILIFAMSNLLYRFFKYLIKLMVYWKKNHYIAHFRILDQIGQGGEGTVYKVENLLNGKKSALKVLDLPKEKESTTRFLREGWVGETVTHPNIVEIYERGEVSGKLYFSMELINGVTLQHIINKHTLEPKTALMVLSVLVDAVHALHENGITHRDLKPGNIMIRKEVDLENKEKAHTIQDIRKALTILDFGIAKFIDSQTITKSGQLAGTLCYIPPEALKGPNLFDTSYDYYSMGIVFYEMITGKKPMDGTNSIEIIYSIIEVVPESPSDINSEIPEEVSELALQLISKDPSKRLRHYFQIRKAVDELLLKHS